MWRFQGPFLSKRMRGKTIERWAANKRIIQRKGPQGNATERYSRGEEKISFRPLTSITFCPCVQVRLPVCVRLTPLFAISTSPVPTYQSLHRCLRRPPGPYRTARQLSQSGKQGNHIKEFTITNSAIASTPVPGHWKQICIPSYLHGRCKKKNTFVSTNSEINTFS